MRPKSNRNKARDWYRNRRWRNDPEFVVSWDGWSPRVQYPDYIVEPHHMRSYYNGKESRTNGNRAVRRHKEFIPDGTAYKKIYDVEWEIW